MKRKKVVFQDTDQINGTGQKRSVRKKSKQKMHPAVSGINRALNNLSLERIRQHSSAMKNKKTLEKPDPDHKQEIHLKNDNNRNAMIKEARSEALKEVMKEREKERFQMDALERKSNMELLRIHSVFPMTFFTDTLIIEETKVNIIKKLFFYSREVKSVLVKDILEVSVSSNIFFGTLKILDRYFTQDPHIITNLKKGDAHKARRIIQGLITTGKENIDYSKFSKEELTEKLENIGTATTGIRY